MQVEVKPNLAVSETSMDELLAEYHDIFQEPNRFPPVRKIAH